MQSLLHLVSGDEAEQQATVSIARNLLGADDIRDVAIVAQSGGIAAVVDDSDLADRIASLATDGVSITACRNTLTARGVDESALAAGVETVPSGAVEVTRLQSEGYAYMRP